MAEGTTEVLQNLSGTVVKAIESYAQTHGINVYSVAISAATVLLVNAGIAAPIALNYVKEAISLAERLKSRLGEKEIPLNPQTISSEPESHNLIDNPSPQG